MKDEHNPVFNESSQNDTNEAVRYFDYLVSLLGSKGKVSEEELSKKVNHSICRLLGIEISSKPEDIILSDILSKSLTPDQRKWAAVCLIRLLPVCGPGWLPDGRVRPRIIQLIESQFADDLYKNRAEEANLQTHEKVERISTIIREAENNLDKSLVTTQVAPPWSHN